MSAVRSVAFAFVTLTLASASPSIAAIADHQQCYKIKDDVAKATYSADLVPSDMNFPVAAGCQVKMPARLLCIDVVKTNVLPTPPGSADGEPAQKSLCYKVKCPKPATAPLATVVDQFGTHNVKASQTSYVCAPVPAPVTTTTLPPSGCLTTNDCPPVPNATPLCSAGNCIIGACNAGWGDCDLDPSSGCEVNTASSANNCGACGLVCSIQNATSTCSSSACAIGSCNAGYSDCDANPFTGCEVNTASDPMNCGSCGNVCPLNAPNCMGGSCQP